MHANSCNKSERQKNGAKRHCFKRNDKTLEVFELNSVLTVQIIRPYIGPIGVLCIVVPIKLTVFKTVYNRGKSMKTVPSNTS